MECPACKAVSSPEPGYQYLGENGKGTYVELYWLKCPNCKEFIVYLKQSSKGYEVLGGQKEMGLELVIHPTL